MTDRLATVAPRGVRLETLRTLRDRLAKDLDETRSARDVAALAKQLSDVLLQIEELSPPTKEVDPLADLVPSG